MTRSYFPKSKESWLHISREERLFCAHLYEFLRKKENCRAFIGKLQTAPKAVVSQDTLQEDNYEVGYEVCFYRDLAHAHDRPDIILPGGRFSPKRTFDLCLFGQKHIIIVEAKAQTYFNFKQLKRPEKKMLKKFFKELGVGSQDVEIVIVCLGSSKLLHSKEGHRKNHTEKVKAKCDFLITWKDLALLDNSDPEFSKVMKRADCCYKE